MSPLSFQHQRGATLISTLIGVVLSLLTIGSMMMLHRTMAVASTQANQELARDSQVQSSLQNALTEIQQAGFGIAPGEAGLNLWTSTDGKRVSWRYRSNLADAGFVCGGLWVVTSFQVSRSQDNPTSEPGLFLFQGVPCTSADNASLWGATSPHRHQLASGRAFYETAGGEALAYSLSRAVFVKGSASACAPFASTPTLSGTHPQVSMLIDGRPVFQSCLVNLLP